MLTFILLHAGHGAPLGHLHPVEVGVLIAAAGAGAIRIVRARRAERKGKHGR